MDGWMDDTTAAPRGILRARQLHSLDTFTCSTGVTFGELR